MRFTVEINWLIDQKRVYSDFNLLPIVNLVVLEAIVKIGSASERVYLSRINTDRAAACIFLTAEILYDCSVLDVFSKMSVTELLHRYLESLQFCH